MKEETFEQSLAGLEESVAKMEDENISLNEAILLFERGMKLAVSCQKKLDEAKKKVEILVGVSELGEPIKKDFLNPKER